MLVLIIVSNVTTNNALEMDNVVRIRNITFECDPLINVWMPRCVEFGVNVVDF